MASKIQMFLHCGKCLKERPDGISPSDYQSIEVGWTIRGLQVRCKRHDANMLHMDLQGRQIPADTTAEGDQVPDEPFQKPNHTYNEVTEEVLDDLTYIITELEVAFKGDTHPLLDAAKRLKHFADPDGFAAAEGSS
jgi:hypothetical protein